MYFCISYRMNTKLQYSNHTNNSLLKHSTVLRRPASNISRESHITLFTFKKIQNIWKKFKFKARFYTVLYDRISPFQNSNLGQIITRRLKAKENFILWSSLYTIKDGKDIEFWKHDCYFSQKTTLVNGMRNHLSYEIQTDMRQHECTQMLLKIIKNLQK